MPIGQLDLRPMPLAGLSEREEEINFNSQTHEALWDAMRKCEDKEQRRSAVLARNRAQSALWEHEQEARDQFSSLHLFCALLAQGRAGESQGLAQAMNTIVSNGTGSGRFSSNPFLRRSSMLCGGNRRPAGKVRLPKTINGYVWFDDQQRAFLVERIANPDGPEGVKRVFLFQYKGSGT